MTSVADLMTTMDGAQPYQFELPAKLDIGIDWSSDSDSDSEKEEEEHQMTQPIQPAAVDWG